MNEKVEIRGRTPVQMMILERRNNFVSCVTFKWIYFCLFYNTWIQINEMF